MGARILQMIIFCRNEVGGWSTEGVELDEKQSNRTRVACKAYHLTSFAVLVSVRDQDGQPVRIGLTVCIVSSCNNALSHLQLLLMKHCQ